MHPTQWMNQLATTLESTQSKVSGRVVALTEALVEFQCLLKQVRARNSSVWWVGNGGSSALCSHLSQDMLNKLRLRSAVLSDASLITCMANDFGYANVYCRPLETLAQSGDLLIAVSSSGKSPNILACADLSVRKKMNLVTLSAFSDENPLWNHPADVSFFLSASLYGLVEVGHEALLHSAIECLWLEETTSSK